MSYVISISGGNDSVACIQYAIENKIENAIIVYINTGWASPDWPDRLKVIKEKSPYPYFEIKGAYDFESLCIHKQAFPRFGMQFCTQHLKGIPFLEFLDEYDPKLQATIILGKRREESIKRRNLEEFIDSSEYHGGRKLWHPLYTATVSERNSLIQKFGIDILPHRSTECFPCVNSGKNMLQVFSQNEEMVRRTERLEEKIGQPMFRAQGKMGAKGIRNVIIWAKSERGQYRGQEDSCAFDMCGD